MIDVLLSLALVLSIEDRSPSEEALAEYEYAGVILRNIGYDDECFLVYKNLDPTENELVYIPHAECDKDYYSLRYYEIYEYEGQDEDRKRKVHGFYNWYFDERPLTTKQVEIIQQAYSTGVEIERKGLRGLEYLKNEEQPNHFLQCLIEQTIATFDGFHLEDWSYSVEETASEYLVFMTPNFNICYEQGYLPGENGILVEMPNAVRIAK